MLIRGLPDFATTYNGREIFTAETRLGRAAGFPVRQHRRARSVQDDHRQSGRGRASPAWSTCARAGRSTSARGQIAGSVWGLYTYQADTITPNAQPARTDRWETGARRHRPADQRLLHRDSSISIPSRPTPTSSPTRIINGQRVRFPDIQRLFYRSGNRVRPSVNAALQWRPNDNFEFYAEGLYQGFRNKIDDRLVRGAALWRRGLYQPGRSATAPTCWKAARSPVSAISIFTFQGGTFNKTDTYQYAVGGNYEAGPLRITADLARTNSTFTGSTESVDRIFSRPRRATSVDFDLTHPAIHDPRLRPSNIRPITSSTACTRSSRNRGATTGRSGSTRNTSSTTASSSANIQVGDALHRPRRPPRVRQPVRRLPRAEYLGQRLPLEYQLSPPGFRGTDDPVRVPHVRRRPTYASIRENREALRQFVIARPHGGFGTFTSEPPAPTRNRHYDARGEDVRRLRPAQLRLRRDDRRA